MSTIKKTFKFEKFVDSTGDEYDDIFGWIDQTNRHFQATDGNGVAHDLLEHRSHEKCSVSAELMAIGTMIHLRYETGWIDVNRPIETSLAYDIDSLFNDWYNISSNCQEIEYKPSKKVSKNADEYVIQWIDKAIIEARGYIFRNHFDDSDYEEQDLEMIDNFLIHVKYWIIKGYERSQRIYSDAYGYSFNYAIGNLFGKIKTEILKMSKYSDVGDKLRISVSLDDRLCTIKHFNRQEILLEF